jgi:hypothetical protein
MDIRERLEVFWAGERPDQIPYTIYQNEWRHTADDPAWQKLFKMGLGVTYHCSPFELKAGSVEYAGDMFRENGNTIERKAMRTPAGEVVETYLDGWRLAFEVSEQYPDNWQESLPVVLDALRETRA